VDASTLVELLLQGGASSVAWRRLSREGESWHAPELIDLEVLQSLRRFQLRREMSEERADAAVAAYREFSLLRYPHGPLLPRLWELRQAMTIYDAAYVGLAEGLGVPLITLDARLAATHGHQARIELIPRA
jgi:predicted nucleic acid-binding protein